MIFRKLFKKNLYEIPWAIGVVSCFRLNRYRLCYHFSKSTIQIPPLVLALP